MSPKFKLTIEDLKKILIGLWIAMLGAAITYIVEEIPNVDFGEWTPIAVALAAVLVNTARKFILQATYSRALPKEEGTEFYPREDK